MKVLFLRKQCENASNLIKIMTNAESLDVRIEIQCRLHGCRGSLAHAVEHLVVALLLGLHRQREHGLDSQRVGHET